MNNPHVRILLVLSAFVAGLVLTTGLVLLASGRFSGDTRQAGGGLLQAILPTPSAPQAAPIGGPFELTDQNGRAVTEADFKGHPTLVFFGFTHCPDVCPTTMFDLSEVMRALGADADRTQGVFVTIDPERDTQAVLKDYLQSFDPHLSALTGNADAIDKMAREYRVYYKKVPLDDGSYTMDHTTIVYLMDKSGRFVRPFSLKRTPQAAAADLRAYL
jgi:protein SCO1